MPMPFSALYDHVLPYLPGAEKPLVDANIRKAAREFLRRTTLVREDFAFTTQPGVDKYQLNGQKGQVSSIIAVHADGNPRPLPVATEEARARGGKKLSWWSPVPTVLAIYPVPDREIGITLEAVVTLRLDATELPDDIVETYVDALAAGTLALMYAMPGKPWTSKEGAQVSGRAFGSEIKSIRGKLRDGGQPNRSTFTPMFRFGA